MNIDERFKQMNKEADQAASYLAPCGRCGGKSKIHLTIWGSSGEDRIGGWVKCRKCGVETVSVQESPRFIDNLTKRWNAGKLGFEWNDDTLAPWQSVTEPKGG